MGLTSRAGVFPLNLRADIAGPMARTVEDAVKVFQVIVGRGSARPGDGRAQGSIFRGLQQVARSQRPEGAVIGVLHEAYERDSTDPEIVRIFMAAVEDLRRAGATVVDPAKVEGLEAIRRPGAGPCMGFKYDLNHFLAERGGQVPVADLAAILKSGKIPSVGAEAAGGCRKRTGERPGFGSLPGRHRLSRTIPRNGGEDDGPAEAGCVRLSDVEQSAAADRGFEYAGRR